MKKKSNWYFILVIHFFFFFITACATEPLPIQQDGLCNDFDIARNGIVHIGTRKDDTSDVKWHGTGFLIDTQCTFATAKHVLNNIDSDKIVIRFQLPKNRKLVKTLNASVLYKHKRKDLAFLKIDLVNKRPCQSGDLHVFSIPNNATLDKLAGENVFIIGHPKISKSNIDIPILRRGIVASTEIENTEYNMILLDLQGVPGFSGSPVILEKTGEAIGIVYGPGPTKRYFGFEWATPINKDDYNEAILNDVNARP